MIKKENIEDVYPLSALQEGMLYHALLDREAATHFQQLRLTVAGDIDADRCRRAFEMLTERHTALRTAFVNKGAARPMQVVLRRRPPDFHTLDLAHLEAEACRAQVAAALAADRRRPFDLETDPLLRVTLIRERPDAWAMVISFHHIIMDGWCMGIIAEELSHIYRALGRGEAPRLPPALPYGAYIRHLESLDSAAAEAFWRRRLAGVTAPTRLPFGRAAGARAPYAHTSRSVTASEAVTSRLRRIAEERRLTLGNLLTSLWGALLMRFQPRPDAVFGQTVATRPPRLDGIEGAVGLYINTLPARLTGRLDEPFIDLAARFQEAALESTDHRHLSLARAQSLTEVGADLIDHVVIFENLPPGQGDPENALGVTGSEMFEQTNYPLELTLFPGEALRARFNYDANRFEEGAVDHLADLFIAFMERLAAHPAQPLGALLACSEVERAEVLGFGTATLRDTGTTQETIIDAWRRAAAETPDKPAVRHRHRRLSFAETDRLAQGVAAELAARGVGPGDRVGILMARSEWLPVAILGVLMSGAAYVPLDPRHPSRRTARIIDRAGCGVVLCRGLAPPNLDTTRPVQWVVPAEPEAGAATAAIRLPAPAAPAYTIFTSGSTGDPKGVTVTHGNVTAFAESLTERFGMTADDVVYAATTVTFDISVLELVCTLIRGMTAVIAEDVSLQRPEETILEIAETGCTVLQLTPTHLRALAECEGFGELAGLRVLLVGGEPFPAELTDLQTRLPGTAVINVYGPTETTIWSTAKRLAAAPPTIGTPLPGESVYILTPTGAVAPVGVWGEICIGGAGVSAGYLGQPELTAERFVADLLRPESRMYRTGDLGRWLPNGEIAFKGRTDNQVKVRGFRIELDEVAGAIRQIPGVSDAAVIVATPDRAPTLAAYYAAAAAIPIPRLRAELSVRLPHYMMPSSWTRLPHLPVTSSGKLDMGGLPAPSAAPAEAGGQAAGEPRTPLESTVLGIFREALETDALGVADNFFDFGGHSLRAMRIVSQIHKATGQEMALADFYEDPTVAGVCGRLDPDRPAARPAIPRAAAQPDYPLLPQQRLLWTLEQMGREAPPYVVYALQRFNGILDEAAIRAAAATLALRHEALRVRLVRRGGEVRQEIADAVIPDVATVDVGEGRDPAARARAMIQAWLDQPFDLATAPLWRVRIIRLPAGESICLLALHHIIGDGESVDILSRELAACYGRSGQGTAAKLSALGASYRDYLAWQAASFETEAAEADRAYWTAQLTPAPAPLPLPTDRPFGPSQRFDGRVARFSLAPELTEPLAAWATDNRATLFAALMTALHALLYRYTGHADITVGVPLSLRDHPDLEGQVGFLTSALPIRNRLSPDQDATDLLCALHRRVNEALDHGRYPFESLVEQLGLASNPGRPPLFDVLFSFRERPAEAARLPGLEPLDLDIDIDADTAKFPLVLELEHQRGRISGSVTYATHLFDADRVERLVGHFTQLVRQLPRRPSAPIAHIDMLTDAERRTVVTGFQPAAPARTEAATLPELFARQAAASAERTALIFGGRSLTYAELDRRADELAAALLETGRVAAETPVAVLLERSDQAVIALLAVMKAGGVYLPIDPEQPAARIQTMLQLSRAPVVVSDLDRPLGPGVGVVHPDAAPRPVGPARPAPSPDAAAYIIFTSGSTGAPKGVVVTHRQITAMILRQIKIMAMGPEDRAAQFASLGFDAAISEIFLALLSGAALLPVPPEVVRDPKRFSAFAAENRVSVVTLPPSYLRLLPDLPWTGLRAVISAGEPGDPDLLTTLAQSVRCYNAYGPTEASVCATMHRVAPAAPAPDFVPIGRPLPGVRAYVLDAHRSPLPVGIPGELYIGGETVARGYLSEEATLAAFLADPFAPKGRVFKTGDRACWLPDGALRIFGRLDDQVKIRGHRIEPEEVRRAMLAIPSVADAVVVAHAATGGDALIGYYLAEAPLDNARLRDQLHRRVPAYMVPAAFVHLAALPKTQSGKVDRARLPEPGMETPPEDTPASPESAHEAAIAEIWSAILGVPSVDCAAPFFALGGNSLRAVKVMFAIEARYDLDLEMDALFEHPTVQGQARLIEALSGARPPT